MATVMLMHWPEVTKEQYEQARAMVNWEGDQPKGGKYHVSWFDGGLHVLDVWDSQADFEKFAAERLGPAVQKIGITSQPNVTFGDVHAIYAPNPSL
jgi:hypothetical protein